MKLFCRNTEEQPSKKTEGQPCELQAYQLSYYPEKKDPIKEMLKMLDNTSPEERLIMEIREFSSQPRIMTLMPQVTIQ